MDRPVAGTAAVREITLGWPGSLELEDSRMNALAVATFAGLDASMPHGKMIPPFRRTKRMHCTASGTESSCHSFFFAGGMEAKKG